MKALRSPFSLLVALVFVVLWLSPKVGAQIVVGGAGGGGAKNLYECPHGVDEMRGFCPLCRREHEDDDCQRARAVLRAKSTYSSKVVAGLACWEAETLAWTYGFKTTEELQRDERHKAEDRDRELKDEADRRTAQGLQDQNAALRERTGGLGDGLGYGEERKNRLRAMDVDALKANEKSLDATAERLDGQALEARRNGKHQQAIALNDRAGIIRQEAYDAHRLAREAEFAQSQSRASHPRETGGAVADAVRHQAGIYTEAAGEAVVEIIDNDALSAASDLVGAYNSATSAYKAFSDLLTSTPGHASPETISGVTDVGLEFVGGLANPSATLAAGAVQAFAVPIRNRTIDLVERIGPMGVEMIANSGAAVDRDRSSGSGSGFERSRPPSAPAPAWFPEPAGGTRPSWAPVAGAGASTPGGSARVASLAALDAFIQSLPGQRPTDPVVEPIAFPKPAPSVRTRYDDEPPGSPSSSGDPKAKPTPKVTAKSQTEVKSLFPDSGSSSQRLRNRYD